MLFTFYFTKSPKKCVMVSTKILSRKNMLKNFFNIDTNKNS